MYSNDEVTYMIEQYIHSARDRAILIDRFVNGLTFCEPSEKHFLSERQIKRIVKKADAILVTLR